MIYHIFFACIMACLFYLLARYKQKRFATYMLLQNVPQSIAERSYVTFGVRCICLISAWILLALCYYTPLEQKAPTPLPSPGPQAQLPKVDEIAFVLDVSASMGAKDTSVGTSRMGRAKEMIETMIEDLGGINISLLAFAGDAREIVPDTLDYLYFRILLESVVINETGVGGTNLLAMCDAVKAKYVDTPYNKSVRVVLLTDGEDTGFLDLASQAKEQAENVLLEHIAHTVSDRLEWEVIGLGSTEGAQVPGITFEAKPVISHMQRSLLQQLARKGHGHFYAESDLPLPQICDNIIADVAGGRSQSVQATGNIQASRLAVGSWLLLAAAALLILASIALPEHKKRSVAV